MERLSKKIAGLLARELKYSPQNEQVMAYGLVASLQMLVVLVCLLIISVPAGIFREAIAVCLAGSLLRRYSGGAHAESIEACTVITVVLCTGFSLLAKTLGTLLPGAVIACLGILLLLCFLILYKLAPVQSPHKPAMSEKRIKKMRRGSFIIISFYILLFAVLFAYKQYSLCLSILLGTLWQCVTMTKPGFSCFNQLDQMLNKMMHLQRR